MDCSLQKADCCVWPLYSSQTINTEDMMATTKVANQGIMSDHKTHPLSQRQNLKRQSRVKVQEVLRTKRWPDAKAMRRCRGLLGRALRKDKNPSQATHHIRTDSSRQTTTAQRRPPLSLFCNLQTNSIFSKMKLKYFRGKIVIVSQGPEMAQCLKGPVARTEESSFIPSTHRMAHAI